MKLTWVIAGAVLAGVCGLCGCTSGRGGAGAGAGASGSVVHPELWPEIEGPVGLDPTIEGAIDDLLERMTLEDKVGQIIQGEIRHLTPDDVRRYRLGSVLNGGGVQPFDRRWASVDEWLELADAFWEASMDTSDGGVAIPVIWGADAVHGHAGAHGATIFPHNIGLGAARDPELIREIGRVTAMEMAVTGLDWTFGPTVAVARDDRWGRTYESWSEDPEIVRAYAAAMVEGLQGAADGEDFLGPGRVIACAKHYLGDGGTEGGVDRGDNLATEAELRDLHGAGYAAALAAGAQTVMASFSSWQGVTMHGHRGLLTEVLKERMGFDGFVVGDWNGHADVPGCSSSSCPAALLAGIDLFMVPEDWRALLENTVEQVASGAIPMDRLDDAVRRILRVKMRAGLFAAGPPSDRPVAGRHELLGSPEHRAVARRAVRESLVLLKNEGGLLPLDPSQTVLVAGDGAHDIGMQCGGWTLTWQGTDVSNDDFPGATSIWDGIRSVVERAGGTALLAEDGSFDVRPDVAVVVFGESPYAEFHGDRETLEYGFFRPQDRTLLAGLREAGIPVVSVFLSGRPMWVNPELNLSTAFVAAWLPGSEGGGVADVLFRAPDGSVAHDFRGRLGFSWPRTAAQGAVNRGDADSDPLFPYGFGLGSGDRDRLGELPEDAGTAVSGGGRTVFFRNGPVSPWHLFVGDPRNPAVRTVGGAGETWDRANLVVAPVDRERQEDARAARWAGYELAALYLASNRAIDLSAEEAAGLELAFDVLVEQRPASRVYLGIRCGEECEGRVDITDALAAAPAGEWRTIAVPLRRLREAGADVEHVTAPFVLATDGALALRFADVRLEPGR